MNRHRRLFVALLCILVCVLALQWWDAARDAEAEAASAVVRERVRVEQAHHARAMAILDERIRRNQIEVASARAHPQAFDFEALVDRTLQAYEAAAAEAVGKPKFGLETHARTLAWMLEALRAYGKLSKDPDTLRLLNLSTLRDRSELPARRVALNALRSRRAALVERVRGMHAFSRARLLEHGLPQAEAEAFAWPEGEDALISLPPFDDEIHEALGETFDLLERAPWAWGDDCILFEREADQQASLGLARRIRAVAGAWADAAGFDRLAKPAR